MLRLTAMRLQFFLNTESGNYPECNYLSDLDRSENCSDGDEVMNLRVPHNKPDMFFQLRQIH